MKYFRITLCLLLLLFIIPASSDTVTINEFKKLLEETPAESGNLLEKLIDKIKSEDSNTSEIIFPKEIENKAFKEGEILEFSIKYGFIRVATSVFKVTKASPIHNRKVYMITSNARTQNFFDMVHKVRDCIISYVDAATLFSYKYIKIQREGGKKINEAIKYNYRNKTFTRYKTKFKRGKLKHNSNTIKLNGFVFDPFAALYYLRTQNLSVNKIISIPVSSSDDIYELKIKVIKKETVNVPAGKFKCYKIRPVLLKEGIFLHKGKMDIWLTADEYKIPVKMKTSIAIGSIKANLKKYHAGQPLFKQ